MKSARYGLGSSRCLLAAAFSLLTLTACGGQRTRPLVSPPVKVELPKAEKPLLAMKALTVPPAPENLAPLPPKEQATKAVEQYIFAVQAWGECAAKWGGLVEWIESQ